MFSCDGPTYYRSQNTQMHKKFSLAHTIYTQRSKKQLKIHKIRKLNKKNHKQPKFSSDVVAALAWEKSLTEKIRHARETLNRKLQPLGLKDTKTMYKEYTFVPYDPHYRNDITRRGVQQCLSIVYSPTVTVCFIDFRVNSFRVSSRENIFY